tara:strand:- start:1907 stop:3688 length:1782 start_codon:yes stop_codon:yes gene_type:complete
MASLSSPIAPTIDVVARTVSSSAISGGAGGGRGGALAVQPQASLVNVERNIEIQTTQNAQQTQEISALRSTIDALRVETTTLNSGLASISNLVQQDSALEKQQAAAEAESERKLAETRIRMGKESQLEQKITNALANPVQALQQKVTNIFGRIGEALTALFAGWLTNQGIEALKANAEGNKNKLEEIKDNVLKHIGYAVGAFAAIKIGFDLIIKTITGLAGKIGGLVLKLATAPLNLIRKGLQAAPIIGPLLGGPKPGAGGGNKPPFKVPNFIGGALSLYTAIRNYGNGEITDAVMQGILGVLSFTPAGRLVSVVRTVLGVSVTADEIAEVFGSNVFGENPDILKQANTVKENAKKEAQQTEKPASAAQTPLMGDKNKKDGVEANVSSGLILEDNKNINSTSDAGTSAPSSTSSTSGSSPVSTAQPQSPMMSQASAPSTPVAQPQTPAIPPPSPEMVKNFEMAWKYKDNSMFRGRIESAWNNMTVEQQQQAKGWAQSTGKDWTQMKLIEKPPAAQTSSLPSAQVQPLPKPTQNVGELTEPAPNVIMMPSSQSNTQQSSISQAPTNGTDTPLISSSNPDNFYVLYSQLNYNVVV